MRTFHKQSRSKKARRMGDWLFYQAMNRIKCKFPFEYYDSYGEFHECSPSDWASHVCSESIYIKDKIVLQRAAKRFGRLIRKNKKN